MHLKGSHVALLESYKYFPIEGVHPFKILMVLGLISSVCIYNMVQLLLPFFVGYIVVKIKYFEKL